MSEKCLEIMSQDRSDLVRLNQTMLDPDGFLPLRARAGIRLKRRASPTGGGAGGGGNNSRRGRNGDDFYPGGGRPAGGPGGGGGGRYPNGIARLKALSSGGGSGTWSDAKVFGRSNSTASASGGGATAAGDAERNGDDEDGPPLLDALVPKKRSEQPDIPSAAPTPTASSLMMAVTPKDQSTTSAWGGRSPWMNGSTPQRSSGSEHGWLSRIASGGGGGMSSPTGSTSSFSFSGASTTETETRGAEMVMHFPPPPQSLLPVFDRELHGFDSSAREDERWGELPFLVVESWGGLGEDAPPGEFYEFLHPDLVLLRFFLR